MMEQLAERRMQREEEAQYAAAGMSHPSMQGHNHGPSLDDDGYDDDEDDEYDSQEYDEDDEEEEMVRNNNTLVEVIVLTRLGGTERAGSDEGRAQNVSNIRSANVRTTGSDGLPRKSGS